MSLRDRLGLGIKGEKVSNRELLLSVAGHIHQQVVIQLMKDQEGALPVTESDSLRERVIKLIQDQLDKDHQELTLQERGWVTELVLYDVFDFGPMTLLLQDAEISEIMVNGPRSVYAEKKGRLELTNCVFRDNRHVMAVVERILAPLGRRVDEACPMVDARLADGSRMNVVIPPVCLNGPTLTIRKFSEESIIMDHLVGFGSLTWEMATFLQYCVMAHQNIIVSGGTGSGKTTMLNALSNSIPAEDRIITIEDAAELKLRPGHVIRLEARPANLEGKGAVVIRDLVKNALRMRPDRIVIGEVRGGEALDLLQAMNTGHDGCLSTLHSNSARDAITRLETLSLMAGLELPIKVVRQQIAFAIDIIIHLERYEDGRRRVSRIAEVQGMEGDVIVLQDIFSFERSGVDVQGAVLGRFERSMIRPNVLDTFRRYGLTEFCWIPQDSTGGTKP